jgi:MraZ protein
VLKSGIKYYKSGELWGSGFYPYNNIMYRGINAITLDSKGRFAVPTRYRPSLGGDLVVTIDTEETCLLLYPQKQWQLIEDRLQELPSFNPIARRIQRLLIGHATDVEMDGAGRVLLPQLLREHAQIDKKIVLIGQGNKFELWDEALWQTRRADWLAEESSVLGALPDEMKTFSL